MDLRSAIHPAALELMLNSATNAAQKGQSQYSTLWKAFHKVEYGKVEVMERLSGSALE
jgi:hypothetical protein